MLKQHSYFTKLAMVALIVGLPYSLLAEMRNNRVSQGNNVGLQVNTGSTPLAGTHQFPKGSGNLIPTFEQKAEALHWFPMTPQRAAAQAGRSAEAWEAWKVMIC